MSSRKRQIISSIVSSLKLINGTTEILSNSPRCPYTFLSNVYDNVYDSLLYLNNINDFPTLCCYVGSPEFRQRIGARETYCSFTLEIRGYVQSENSILSASDLAQDIQYIIDSMHYRSGFKELGVVECRTESLATDEGLLEPIGVAEVKALIVYIQDYKI